MRRSDLIAVAVALWTGAAAGAAPERVVSLNVCTDQMAWLLAPEALVAVSPLAADPQASAHAEGMAGLPVTPAAAEAVMRVEPDLVLAGTYTTRATVALIRDLGVEVAEFAPPASLEDVWDNLRRMGDLLERRAAADAMISAMQAELAALPAPDGPRPEAALYYPGGNSGGTRTLPGDILRAAGLDNLAEARDLPFGGALPLESLVRADPDLILVGAPHAGHARATELLSHPAIADRAGLHRIATGPAWSCETPALVDAIREMVALRQSWEAAR